MNISHPSEKGLFINHRLLNAKIMQRLSADFSFNSPTTLNICMNARCGIYFKKTVNGFVLHKYTVMSVIMWSGDIFKTCNV